MVAAWTGAITYGRSDCNDPSACYAGYLGYFTLPVGVSFTTSTFSQTVNRSSVITCAMTGIYNSSLSNVTLDSILNSNCSVFGQSTESIGTKWLITIYKPTTTHPDWEAQLVLDQPVNQKCTSGQIIVTFRSPYQPSTPCTPGAWTYSSTDSTVSVGDTHFQAGVTPYFFKVGSFAPGAFTLT